MPAPDLLTWWADMSLVERHQVRALVTLDALEGGNGGGGGAGVTQGGAGGTCVIYVAQF